MYSTKQFFLEYPLYRYTVPSSEGP